MVQPRRLAGAAPAGGRRRQGEGGRVGRGVVGGRAGPGGDVATAGLATSVGHPSRRRRRPHGRTRR
eukprot:44273-Pleurochrysis_carterae.AAC.1